MYCIWRVYIYTVMLTHVFIRWDERCNGTQKPHIGSFDFFKILVHYLFLGLFYKMYVFVWQKNIYYFLFCDHQIITIIKLTNVFVSKCNIYINNIYIKFVTKGNANKTAKRPFNLKSYMFWKSQFLYTYSFITYKS